MTKKIGYLANIKAQLADKQTQLETVQADLQGARAESSEADQAVAALDIKEHLPLTAQQELAYSRADRASHRLREVTRDAQDLAAECRRLRSIVDAPAELQQAGARVKGLLSQRTTLQTERSRAAELVDKLGQRVATLEIDGDAELRSTADAMATAGTVGVIPESLLRQEVELRVTRAALSTATEKLAALDAGHSALSGQIRDAHDEFRACQSAVAEVELQQVIHANIHVIARASAASHAAGGWARRADQYTVDIPPEALEAARANLASEIPAE